MSAFWKSEVGEITGSMDDAFAKSFKIVPDGTMALAKIESFTNAEYMGKKYIQIDWVLTDGDFKGQKVNQKLKVFDQEPKVKYRSLNMLKLIYDMFKIKPNGSDAPTDQDFRLFVGKIAGIKVRETEPNAEGKQYNWVSEVHNAAGFKSETGVKLVVTHVNEDLFQSALSRNKMQPADNLVDDIPF